MPIILALVVMIAMFAFMILMIPFSLVWRYRAGTSRRPARGWMITLNLYAAALSTTLFLIGAAISNTWIPNAFSYSAMGLLGGFFAGALGLALTRWEPAPNSFHFTPSRLLIMSITLLVMARIGYGFVRSWRAWHSTTDTLSWIAQSGAAGSMAAGAVVIGYYLIYWAGVRRRYAKHAALTGRTPGFPRVPRAPLF